MQPYFFPYIGYFQLLNAVDEFILYDNIEYTKKGWINRNRILSNGKEQLISIPIKKDSDYLSIEERSLSDGWNKDKMKLFNKIKESYRKAPYFNQSIEVIESCLLFKEQNLFQFIHNSLIQIAEHLNINTPIIRSSEISIDHSLKSQEKVLALCNARECSTYVNPIGGLNLYNKGDFLNENIDLRFIKSNSFEYVQFKNEFIPWLSVVDVIMFNSQQQIKKYLNEGFTLIEN